MHSKSFFVKAVAVLVAGNFVAQVLNLVLIPLITRIYSPSELGMFGSFMAPALAFVPVVMLGVNVALMYERDPNRKADLFGFGLKACFFMSLLVALGFMIVKSAWGFDYGIGRGTFFVLFVFLFFLGMQRLFTFFLNSVHCYKAPSTARLVDALIGNGTMALLGLFGVGVLGLVVGRFVGVLTSVAVLAVALAVVCAQKTGITGSKILASVFELGNVKKIFEKYSGFLGYGYLALVIENIVRESTVLLCALMGGATLAGYYGLVHRVLYLPAGLFGGAVSTVFYNWFMERTTGKTSNKNGKAGNATPNSHGNDVKEGVVMQQQSVMEKSRNKRTYQIVVLMLTVLTGVSVYLFFAGGGLFALLFGDDWRQAGYIAGVLAPAFLFSIPRVMLRPVFDVFGKQKFLFALSVIRNLVWVGCFAVFWLTTAHDNFLHLATALSVTNVFFQLIGIYYGVRLLNVRTVVFLKDIVLLGLLVLTSFVCYHTVLMLFESSKLSVVPLVTEVTLPLTVLLPFVIYTLYMLKKFRFVGSILGKGTRIKTQVASHG